MATDNYKHDGAVKIKLSHDNDEITVWPSVEAPGSVTIALLDSEEPRTNVGIASPPECDALIAAIGRALGRAAPASTPLADAFDVLANERDAQGKACWNTDGDGYHGEATAYRHAAAMVREQGATVPRAPLSEALPLLVELRSFLPFGRASRLVDLVTCYVTDALGVPLPEKSAAPITPEKG